MLLREGLSEKTSFVEGSIQFWRGIRGKFAEVNGVSRGPEISCFEDYNAPLFPLNFGTPQPRERVTSL